MSSNSRRIASYNLIMHRRALLDMIQKWTSPSLLEQQECLPTWLTNEVTVHKIADPEDGSVELDAQSKLVSTMSHPQSSSRTRISAESVSSSVSSGLSTNSSTSRYNFLQVQWADWGPPISRWFQLNETQGWEISVSNGQRYAFSDPNPRDRGKLMVSVADFNPHNFRRNAETMTRLRSGEGENNGSSDNNEEEGEKGGFEILDHKGVFSEEVYMGLKCVVYRAPDEYDFGAVMMDEQRLLGVKLNRDGLTESIKVLYIG
ncbi:hypothetical protein M378DRAFT_15450 [Amanita muscaria Koide BX008]|uniref:Uncharacterized protein n=1 Tax=Amanita muscaria (strain Koide BX008) TaxID=946122 RepID=A0A0C2SWW7_AMAMK|nr:hypothetical protein M378DRAFT_15450 [Amanita muscaria Koide BX008]